MKKSPWKSKTLWVNFALASVTLFIPGAKDFISENPSLVILLGSIINIILRFVTSEKIIAALLLMLTISCAEYQQLEIDMYHKKDIGIKVNGNSYEGVTVIPRADKYEITLEPKGDMDLILVRSCHREHSFEKKSKKFLWIRIGSNSFQYTYEPSPKEKNSTCPLRVEVYESINGRHSWALLDFEHPDYKMEARILCNGEVKTFNGVSICQAKVGLIQSVEFPDIVDFADPPDGCMLPVYKDGAFDWEMSKGECLYHIRNAKGELHRMTTIGYEGVLVREGQ